MASTENPPISPTISDIAELQAMTLKSPAFDITLDDPIQTVRCLKVVRLVPGKRIVCHADYAGADVYIKLYFGGSSPKKLWSKEILGLTALANGGIATAPILWQGTTMQKQAFAVILKAIPNAVDASTKLRFTHNDSDCLAQLEALVTLCAQHHQAGIIQTDIHLGNFLWSKNSLVTLDGGGIISGQSLVNTERALENLALLFAQLSWENRKHFKHLLNLYLRFRDLPDNLTQWPAFASLIRTALRKRQRRYLNKIFRDCTNFRVTRTGREFIAIRRENINDELVGLLASPNDTLSHPDSEVLRQGYNVCSWKTFLGGQEIIITRFEANWSKHLLRKTGNQHPASLAWRNSHRLQFHEIPSLLPIALIRRRHGFFSETGWLITEACDAHNLESVLIGLADKDKRQALATKVTTLLSALQSIRVTHGALTPTNVLISDQHAIPLHLETMQGYDNSNALRYKPLADTNTLISGLSDDSGFSALLNSNSYKPDNKTV